MFRCYIYRSRSVKLRLSISKRNYTIPPTKTGLKIPDLDEVKDVNEMHALIFARLSRVYRLLGSRSRRFKYSAKECHDLYLGEHASLFEDLLKYPRINRDMITFLFVNYSFSNSIKALVLDDLTRLLFGGKFDIVIKTFEYMIERGIVSKSTETGILHLTNTKIPDSELKSGLANLIIKQAIYSGEHILAASFALDFNTNGIPIDGEALGLLLRSLAIDTTANHTYNSYTIIKVLNEFSIESIDLSEICQLVLYLMEGGHSPFFANILFNKILHNSLLTNQSSIFHRVGLKLIEKNIDYGNVTRAITIWNSIKNFTDRTDEDALVLSKIITILFESENKIADKFLLENLSTEISTHPDMRDCILRVFGREAKHIDKFEDMIKQLKPPLRRLTLLPLLEAFLIQNNESGAERILLTIFNTKNGINYLEFNAIIKKLLKQQKIDQCMEMLKSTDIEVSKRGYISVFEHVIGSPVSEKRNEFLEDLTIRFQRLKTNDECLKLLTVRFLEYISKKMNNRLSRSLFLTIVSRSQKNHTSLTANDDLNIERFSLPKGLLLLLSLEGNSKYNCLKMISKHAIRDHDIDTLKWCVDEMRFSGVLLEDILKDILEQDSMFADEVFKEEALRYIHRR